MPFKAKSRKIMYMGEEYIRLIVRPKPKYIPHFFWRWLLRRILYIEHMVGLPHISQWEKDA